MSLLGEITGLAENDLERLRMGRMSTEDEALIRRLILERGGPSALFRILGLGATVMTRPALRTTRPSTPEGVETVVFRHKTIAKARVYPVDRQATWFSASDPETGKAAGAKWDRRVLTPGGDIGAWRSAVPGVVPVGGTRIAPLPRPLGYQLGCARRAHRYVARIGQFSRPEGMEDASTPSYSAGTGSAAGGVDEPWTEEEIDAGGVESVLGPLTPDDDTFWDQVEHRERHGGRVQSRIIAELPYEEAVGTDGRREIVRRFCGTFDGLGLPWFAAVHRPEPSSDPRNFHVHILYHTRPARRSVEQGKGAPPARVKGCSRRSPVSGGWTFGRHMAAETRGRDWLPKLRRRWAAEINRVLADRGIRRRVDPRRYEVIGIAKTPTVHLGAAAMALERRGVPTRKGGLVISAEGMWRIAKAERRYARLMVGAVRRVERVLEADNRHTSPFSEISRAATGDAVETAHDLLDAAKAVVRAQVLADLDRWRAEDLPSRIELIGRAGDPSAAVVAAELRRRAGASFQSRNPPPIAWRTPAQDKPARPVRMEGRAGAVRPNIRDESPGLPDIWGLNISALRRKAEAIDADLHRKRERMVAERLLEHVDLAWKAMGEARMAAARPNPNAWPMKGDQLFRARAAAWEAEAGSERILAKRVDAILAQAYPTEETESFLTEIRGLAHFQRAKDEAAGNMIFGYAQGQEARENRGRLHRHLVKINEAVKGTHVAPLVADAIEALRELKQARYGSAGCEGESARWERTNADPAARERLTNPDKIRAAAKERLADARENLGEAIKRAMGNPVARTLARERKIVLVMPLSQPPSRGMGR